MEKIECKNCRKKIIFEEYRDSFKVCSHCGYHDRLGARERIDCTVDSGSFKEMGAEIASEDPLGFVDLKPYTERLSEARAKSGLEEAIVVGSAFIGKKEVGLGVMDFNFMGGSMGSVVGQKIKMITDFSIEQDIPLLIFSTSGGARMQEGILSLMQMAKTVSCIRRLSEKNIPYFSVITNPTTGGVSASFASIADIIIAEPGALFCFAGPRVVKQTIKKEIPQDFGTAERNLANGQIDMIVQRKDMRDTIIRLMEMFKG
ncbi:MAG: acetyl-CoA carboxylase carboxyltransferase subunit beta [Actinomycetota bacterium]